MKAIYSIIFVMFLAASCAQEISTFNQEQYHSIFEEMFTHPSLEKAYQHSFYSEEIKQRIPALFVFQRSLKEFGFSSLPTDFSEDVKIFRTEDLFMRRILTDHVLNLIDFYKTEDTLIFTFEITLKETETILLTTFTFISKNGNWELKKVEK